MSKKIVKAKIQKSATVQVEVTYPYFRHYGGDAYDVYVKVVSPTMQIEITSRNNWDGARSYEIEIDKPEAPTFKKPTINIGDRQRGRLKATSVIDCEPARAAIGAAIERIYSADLRAPLETVRNPYGEGGASEAIVRVLREVPHRHLACLWNNPVFAKPKSPWLTDVAAKVGALSSCMSLP